MTKLLVWWQAYKAALAGGYASPGLIAECAVQSYAKAKFHYGKELA